MKLPILFTIFLFLQNNFQLIFATTSKGYQDFITISCSNTTYPSLCNEYLSSYATNVKGDHLKLCSASLDVSLQAAKNSSAVVSSLSKQKDISKSDMGVIKDCIYNIKDSVDELKQSINALASINNSTDKKFQLSTIKTEASAAMTDEETCIDELDNASGSVKNKLTYVIVNFERITSNALFFINRLNY